MDNLEKEKPVERTKGCPVCTSPEVVRFVEVPQIPAFANVFWATREEAIQAPKGDIRLGFCRTCGHVYNVSFNPDRIVYDQAYENSLHFSPRFQVYARTLANQLINRYSLRGKQIIEIGCGKGDFLTMLCELGENRGIGFDPSYVPDRLSGAFTDRITFIQDYYSERYSYIKADFICCRQVLEHIPEPESFIGSLRKAIGGRPGIIVFFEVPNVRYTIEDLGIWDLIYEHCSYFSDMSLFSLFTLHGFTIREIKEAFERQYLLLEASATDNISSYLPVQFKNTDDLFQTVMNFSERYTGRVGFWKEELQGFKDSGKKVVLWGAGSKGVTFLNTLRISEQIEYVVDVNPHKQGKFIGGTGQEIVAPTFLLGYKPDVVIMMNPVYQDEIFKTISKMNITVELTHV